MRLRISGLRGVCAAVVTLLIIGCATAPTPIASDIQITTGQGVRLNAEQALAALRQADHVLLGEVHDNPVHHQERATLLTALSARRPTVVFEQFPRSTDAALPKA